MTAFAGCFTAGLANVWLGDNLGFGVVCLHRSTCCQVLKRQVAPLGAFSQAISYAIMMFGPPFPIFVLAWVFTGFGFALQVRVSFSSMLARILHSHPQILLSSEP
jgi:hypothetical protein